MHTSYHVRSQLNQPPLDLRSIKPYRYRSCQSSVASTTIQHDRCRLVSHVEHTGLGNLGTSEIHLRNQNKALSRHIKSSRDTERKQRASILL